jgi:3-oxoacyl-[acyl-carrier-protein] synthase II
MQAIHALQTEQMAAENCDPAKASRPFDKNRTGMVAGEGAGVVVLEELESARSPEPHVAESLRNSDKAVSEKLPYVLRGKCDVALSRAIKAALRDAGSTAADIGHINAHGLSTTERDVDESRAIREVFGPLTEKVPVAAPKSYFGNLGAGSAVVELITSVLALREARLPRVLNYEAVDPACAIHIATDEKASPGRSFLNLSVTPQGQAAVLLVAAIQ